MNKRLLTNYKYVYSHIHDQKNKQTKVALSTRKRMKIERLETGERVVYSEEKKNTL